MNQSLTQQPNNTSVHWVTGCLAQTQKKQRGSIPSWISLIPFTSSPYRKELEEQQLQYQEKTYGSEINAERSCTENKETLTSESSLSLTKWFSAQRVKDTAKGSSFYTCGVIVRLHKETFVTNDFHVQECYWWQSGERHCEEMGHWHLLGGRADNANALSHLKWELVNRRSSVAMGRCLTRMVFCFAGICCRSLHPDSGLRFSRGSHADRSWRGEVLVLEEFCRIFGVHDVIGIARLYFSTVPCVSTVCVLAPFCQLLPDVKLTAVNGFQCSKKKNFQL